MPNFITTVELTVNRKSIFKYINIWIKLDFHVLGKSPISTLMTLLTSVSDTLNATSPRSFGETNTLMSDHLISKDHGIGMDKLTFLAIAVETFV